MLRILLKMENNFSPINGACSPLLALSVFIGAGQRCSTGTTGRVTWREWACDTKKPMGKWLDLPRRVVNDCDVKSGSRDMIRTTLIYQIHRGDGWWPRQTNMNVGPLLAFAMYVWKQERLAYLSWHGMNHSSIFLMKMMKYRHTDINYRANCTYRENNNVNMALKLITFNECLPYMLWCRSKQMGWIWLWLIITTLGNQLVPILMAWL